MSADEQSEEKKTEESVKSSDQTKDGELAKSEDQTKDRPAEESEKESSDSSVRSSGDSSSTKTEPSQEPDDKSGCKQTTEDRGEEPSTSSQRAESTVCEETPRRKNATMVDFVAKHIESLFALIEKKQ